MNWRCLIKHLVELPWKTIVGIGLVLVLTVAGIVSIRATLGMLENSRNSSAAHLVGTPGQDLGDASRETESTQTTPDSDIVEHEAEYTDDVEPESTSVDPPTSETTAEPTAIIDPAEVTTDGSMLTLSNGVYLRSGPGPEYEVLGSEPSGFTAPVTGRSEDGEWYQIKYGANVRVWVAAAFSSLTVSKTSVPIVVAPALPPATSVPVATAVPLASPTAESSGLATASSDAISSTTFSVDGTFKPGSVSPSFLAGESIYVNMTIKNSSNADVSFGAWGVYSDQYPNFHYIFNGDRDADKIGANTEYSWRAPITIPGAGTHGLQMGICLGNAAYCLGSKPPSSDWYILSGPIPVNVTSNRMSPVAPSGSPISGTLFSVEKECKSGSICTPDYLVNQSIWTNMRIMNLTGEDQSFGAWGIFADPYIFRFFNGEGNADKVAAGTEYNWRDHIEFPAAGSYDLKMVICLAGSGTCRESVPPAEHWYILSESVPLTIQ